MDSGIAVVTPAVVGIGLESALTGEMVVKVVALFVLGVVSGVVVVVVEVVVVGEVVEAVVVVADVIFEVCIS